MYMSGYSAQLQLSSRIPYRVPLWVVTPFTKRLQTLIGAPLG